MNFFDIMFGSETLKNLDLENSENAPFHYHLKDHKGKYISCNKRVILDAGFSKADDFLGLTDLDLDFLPETQALEIIENDEWVRRTGKSKLYIEPVTLPCEKKMIAISYKVPLRLRSKKTIGTKSLSFIVESTDYILTKTSLIPNSIDSVKLSKQQLNCLFYSVKGMTMKKIATTLDLSPKTVEHYLDAIKIKLNCYSRSELIEKALQLDCIREKL